MTEPTQTTNTQFIVQWQDAGKEPRVAPNPNYPDGKDLDLREGDKPSCYTRLPYPARRIGAYVIECRICGLRVACTTAGRPDDPRSITVTCKRMAVV